MRQGPPFALPPIVSRSGALSEIAHVVSRNCLVDVRFYISWLRPMTVLRYFCEELTASTSAATQQGRFEQTLVLNDATVRVRLRCRIGQPSRL